MSDENIDALSTSDSISEVSPSNAKSMTSVISGSSKFKKKPALMSTWHKRLATDRNFITATTSEHKRADDSAYMEAWNHEDVSKQLDLHRGALGQKAISRFQSLAEKKYGSVRNMMRSFQKGEDDVISLDELSKNLHKRNLDNFLSREDQRLIFELYGANFGGSVHGKIPVKTFVEGSHEESKAVPRNINIDEIRCKIGFQLTLKSEATKAPNSARSQERQMKRDLRNLDPESTGYLSKESFSIALGKKYLGLELSDKEQNQVFEELCEIRDSKAVVNYDKFAKFLDIVNVEPNHIPFFDSKGGEVSGLKFRIQMLEEMATEPIRLARVMTLKEEHQRLRRALDERDSRLVPTGTLPSKAFAGPLKDTVQLLSTVALEKKSKLYPSPGQSDSKLQLMGGASQSLGQLPPLSSEHHLHEHSLSHSLPQSLSDYSYHTVAHNLQESAPEVFGPKPSTASRVQYKNPLIVQAAPAVLPEAVQFKTGKKLPPTQSTDWTRVGYGSNEPRCGSTLSGMEVDNSKRYQTTTDSYFPPVKYALDGTISRDMMSDAEKDRMKRLEKFENRLARTKHNIEVSRNRVELEELLKQLTQERRAQHLARNNLKYVSNLYLQDLKGFEKLPLNQMQRKSNPEMYKKTWGDHQTDRDVPDTRSFVSSSHDAF